MVRHDLVISNTFDICKKHPRNVKHYVASVVSYHSPIGAVGMGALPAGKNALLAWGDPAFGPNPDAADPRTPLSPMAAPGIVEPL
jgi:hypothetical protein